jgi:methionyl-tRNA formyltransferase
MRVVIIGYGEMFESLVLGVLKTEHEIVGVFRQDRTIYSPFNLFFHDLLKPSQDYNFIKRYNLHEIKANSVNSEEFREELEELCPDIVFVGSWGEKFSIQTINIPLKACINVHPSLLPKYRGPNPYMQVILNEESKTGITFHLMDVNYDTGSILHQKRLRIYTSDTGKSLKQRCCDAARKEVVYFLNDFTRKLENQQSQNEKDATYQPRISVAEAIIDFTRETAAEIDRKIRAFTPWLECFICYHNEFFAFENYRICKKISSKPPATIIKKTKNSLYIVCQDKSVIEFSSLKIKRPFSKILTKYYLSKIIKEKEKVD